MIGRTDTYSSPKLWLVNHAEEPDWVLCASYYGEGIDWDDEGSGGTFLAGEGIDWE